MTRSRRAPFRRRESGIRLAGRQDLPSCASLISRTHGGLDLFRPYTEEFLADQLDEGWRVDKPAGWLATCGTSEVSFEESVSAEPGGRLVVEFAQGSVEVRTHASSEVRVEAVVRGEDARRVQFFLGRDGRDVELVSEIGLGLPPFRVFLEIDSRIWIPEEFGLEAETNSADVTAIGIGGDVFVDTSRAAVEIETRPGRRRGQDVARPHSDRRGVGPDRGADEPEPDRDPGRARASAGPNQPLARLRSLPG